MTLTVDPDSLIARLEELDDESVGKELNLLADLFRRGADLAALRPALRHSDSRLVSAAAWIVAEIVDERRGRELLPDLCELLNHSDSAVRFQAVKGVAAIAGAGLEGHVLANLIGMLDDSSPSVRRQALVAVCDLSDEDFAAAARSGRPEARLVNALITVEDVTLALKGPRRLTKRLAVLAAVRSFAADDSVMDLLREQNDVEVAAELPNLIQSARRVKRSTDP